MGAMLVIAVGKQRSVVSSISRTSSISRLAQEIKA
jgi:hypothetical protein